MTTCAHHKDPDRARRVVECKQKYPHLTASEIAERFGMSKPYVSNVLRKAGIRTYAKKDKTHAA